MRRPRTDRIGKGAAGGGRRLLCAATAAVAWLLPAVAPACPSCYGSASGPVIDAMNLAVLVMVGITGGVFSWIVAFALRIVRREREERP